MNDEQLQTASLLLQWFRGRSDYIAVDKGEGFRPQPLSKELTADKFAKTHLAQDMCLGFYLLNEDSTVWCTALDFDNHDGNNPAAQIQACKAYRDLVDAGLTPILEVSQSGNGMHLWLSFTEPVPATYVVQFWKEFKRRASLSEGLEHYPRQSSLNGLKLGNLIRYPLYGESRFVIFTAFDEETLIVDLVNQTPERLLTSGRVKQHTKAELVQVMQWWEIDPEESEETVDVLSEAEISPRVRRLLIDNATGLLGRRWAGDITALFDPSRSGLSMSIATELVRSYVPTNEIEDALRYWSRIQQYEKGQREDFIRRTVNKAYDMVVHRREKKSLTGDTFAGLAHQYADAIKDGDGIIIPTGIKACDASFGGFGFGELVAVSARPNQGKTALAMQCADHAALMQLPVLLISLEMSASESSRRVLLSVGKLETDQWRTDDGNKILHRNIDAHYSKRAPMYFVEGVGTIDRIDEVIDKYVQDHGVKFVVIDYQGLASAGEKTEYADQTKITKRLKQAASRNEIILLTLVQMNRQIEHEERPPRLSDLKGTGEIEASADLILFGHWPYKINADAPRDMYVVYAAKARNRRINSPEIQITFDDDKQVFR